jgi:hypothetical protein
LDGGSARRKASTYTGQRNTEKRGHILMPREEFEPTIPVFERPNTVRASDSEAIKTLIVSYKIYYNDAEHKNQTQKRGTVYEVDLNTGPCLRRQLLLNLFNVELDLRLDK